MPRQQLCVAFADMADAEREDQPVQFDGAAGVDRREQIAHRGLAIAFALGELVGGAGVALLQRKDVDRRHHETVLVEFLNLFVAEPIDIERQPRNEMLEPFRRLRGTDQRPGAAANHLIVLANGMATAHRTDLRKFVRFRVRRPFLQHNIGDLRNHVAGALHDHGVADADIDAVADRAAVIADPLDVVFVVQRGVLHHDAADRDRRKPRHRRQRAGAADLDVDAVQDRRRLLCRELVRDRPARAARHEAEAILPVETVDLVDHTVDVVAKRGAVVADLAVELQDIVDALAQLGARIDDKAGSVHPLQHASLRIGLRLAHLAPGIGEELQRPGCCDRDVLLAQRTRRGIARIGEYRIVGFGLLPVQLQKILLEHVDLAPHLAGGRNITALQRVRNILDGADIGGDVLAGKPVAAGGRAHQFAVLVAQRQRQPVDLGFGGDRGHLVGVKLEEAPDAFDELGDILVAEGIAERQHGNDMLHLGEPARRRGADLLRRRILIDEIGIFRLDRFQPLTQRIIGRIRYGRRILLVVAFVVRLDLKRQPHLLDLGLCLGELGYVGEGFLGFGHHATMNCHSGAMRSIEPGSSRFRVRASRARE